MDRRNVWKTYTQAELKEMEDISTRYKRCLDEGKTERECVEVAERLAEEAGYRSLCAYKAAGETLKEGDKVYASFMGKMILLLFGQRPKHPNCRQNFLSIFLPVRLHAAVYIKRKR